MLGAAYGQSLRLLDWLRKDAAGRSQVVSRSVFPGLAILAIGLSAEDDRAGNTGNGQHTFRPDGHGDASVEPVPERPWFNGIRVAACVRRLQRRLRPPIAVPYLGDAA